MNIKAIGFDIDGTLYSSAWMMAAAIPSFLFAPRLTYHFSKMREEIRRIRYDEKLHDIQARLVAHRIHVEPEEARQRIERHLYRRWENSFRIIRPFRGVRETLLSLTHAGFPLAALSDFPPAHKLSSLGIEDLFTEVIGSEETGYLKPNPEPFLYLSRLMGVPPEEILYVGNSSRYDIGGALSVGMKTAHIARCEKGDERADFVFSRFSSLRDWLLANNN